MSYVLISFETPHHTIKADKSLEEMGINRAVFPIPREISRDCGMGLRIDAVDLDRTLQIFTEKGILYKRVFPVNEKGQTPSLIDRLTAKDQPH